MTTPISKPATTNLHPVGGRPYADDLIAVAIPERHMSAAWDPLRRKFVGSPELCRFATLYAITGHTYKGTPGREPVVCGTDTEEQIMASLLAACSGRGVVLGERSLSR